MSNVVIETSDSRVIPAEFLCGVAELAALFTEHIREMRLPDDDPFEVTRPMVSTWYARRNTTMFPDAVVTHLGRGFLWDMRDFVDMETNRLKWNGPPGRWARRRMAEVHPEAS